MTVAPLELWTRAQAREADAYAMEVLGAPAQVLMERVAVAAAGILGTRWPERRRLDVYAGPGNNGADGVAVARILAARGWDARVMLATPRGNDARTAQVARARAVGVTISQEVTEPREGAVVVDALLGTGSHGAPRPEVRAAIEVMEGCETVVAIDVPTGVNADDGAVEGPAVRAAVTVTVERSKPGLHITPGRALAGDVVVARVGIARAEGSSPSRYALIGAAQVGGTAPNVPPLRALWDRAPHKGARGHVGLWGGAAQTPGAAALAALACLRAGAGMVTVRASSRDDATLVVAARPEVMLDGGGAEVLAAADGLVVGPGLLEAEGGLAAPLRACWDEDPRPAVWDASALRVVGTASDGGASKRRGARVITPHPGEAAALRSIVEGRSIDAATVQRSRLDTARGLAAHLDAVVVLKGLGTVVATPSGEVWIATEGSSVLATAGTGDVLAGLVGTLLAQGVSATRAACAGVLVHAVAGACAGAELAERGEGAPTASDVAARLGEAAAGLEGPDADQWMVHLPRQRWG